MAEYSYTVKNKKGEIVKGTIHSTSIRNAAMKLEMKGFIVLEIKELADKTYASSSFTEFTQSFSSVKVLSLKEKIEFFNSFYYMYKSGLSIVDIFSSVKNATKNKYIKAFCQQILNKIAKGHSLKEALKHNSSCIGIAYSALIVAGEESGKLDDVLSNTIKNLKREEKIKSNLIKALAYPTFICLMAIGVFMLFKYCILQQFENIASRSGGASFGCLLVGALIRIALFYAFVIGTAVWIYFDRKIQQKIISIVSSLKIFSGPVKSYYFSNFFSVLGLAYQSGIPIQESCTLALSVINSLSIKLRIKQALKMLSNGCDLTTAFNVAGVFSPFALSQISTGEKSGEIDKMSLIIANDYEKKLDGQIDIFLKMLGPISLIFVGFIVLYVAYKGYTGYYSIFSSF